jgi:hypothetical protein
MNFRYFLLIISIAVIDTTGYSQTDPLHQHVQPFSLSENDILFSESLPAPELPDSIKSIELPVVLDNSGSPYLRPVFNQNSACCGQASGVAYNFTYEINRLRNLPSADTINQYPSHFTWNFQNSGDGYFGVSYLHSFEILKKAGNPNVFDYGGMDNTEGVEWMTGYQKYYNSMLNRVREVSQIKVNSEEGLLTLKHWLHNHLEGSEHGGIASFYAASPWGYNHLPDGSPEAGKIVMTEFQGTAATHAMTIVGYHDSIRYDYNGDGQYTNHIDLNKDGVVDMKDYEIGGLKFVNSYGDNWGDSGFCYMMYKTLADKLGEGGIWNHCVHMLDVKQSVDPKITMKFTIKHDSREKIKITAGVASDTAANLPEHVIHFPIFDYQGGHNFMQGRRQNELNKYLETGLDITPLLGFIEPGQPAKFFLQVAETDPLNEGTGRIIGLTLMDYNDEAMEVPCQQTDVQLVENGMTRLGIVHAPDFDKVEITTAELPATEAGSSFEVQLEAQNGTEPRQWNLINPYYQQQFDFPMPGIDEEQLFPEFPGHKFAGKKINFEFPFFGKKYDTVYVHQNGFVMFEPDLYPWPYFNDPFLLFKKVKNISAFYFSPVEYYNDPLRDEPEMWYEGNEFYAAFRWNGPLYYFDEMVGEGEFAVVLNHDGMINFYYDGIQVDEDVVWYAGVSAGDETDYTLLNNANTILLPEVSSFTLLPEILSGDFDLTDEGFLSGTPDISEEILNLTIRVFDDNRISDTRVFQLSDGLIFDYSINAGDDGFIENGEQFTIDLTVKNIFNQPFYNVEAHVPPDENSFLEILDGTVFIGDIAAGESKTVNEAFVFMPELNCPDGFNFYTGINFSSDEADWQGSMNFKAYSPSMMIRNFLVQDDNNQRLDPGETADISINIFNSGMLGVDDIQVSLTAGNNLITISNPVQSYGSMDPGEEKAMLFSVTAAQEIEVAEEVTFDVVLSFASGYEITKTYTITIGQYTAVVFRKGSNPASAEAILDAMTELGVEVIYTTTLPEDFGMYRSVFVCLGGFLENVALTQDEAAQLSAYLSNGGNLYMEGTMTWTFDPQTSLHPRFNAGAQPISFINFEQMTGVSGTFTEGMAFDFSGTNNILPCLMNPEEPAYAIFEADGDADKCIATANPAWNYKTIGAVNEFGTMGDDTNAEERKAYLYGIFAFFGLEDFIVNVPEQAGISEATLLAEASPNPFKSTVDITLQIDEAAGIDIDIYDLSGQYIMKLLSDVLMPGSHTVKWGGYDRFGKQVPPGIYIYQVRSGGAAYTGKLIRME